MSLKKKASSPFFYVTFKGGIFSQFLFVFINCFSNFQYSLGFVILLSLIESSILLKYCSLAYFFKLLTLFLKCLYFVQLSDVWVRTAFVRCLFRFRKLSLISELNQGLSSGRKVTSLEGIHSFI